jgi:tripartite-type tricarboxylate transporter receptor subunit TctC
LTLTLCAASLMLAAGASVARADSEADSYQGKQIRIIIGFGNGGTSDIFARTLARYMGKHLPGAGAFVPQNMPGGGGIKSANYLYNVAPKDGTMFGNFSRTVPLEPLLGKKEKTQFDALKFTWLGSPSQEVSTCASWHTTPVKSFEDLRKHQLILGSTGSAAASTVFPKLFNAELGTKFKLVLGYSNSVTILKAMEQGEVQGFCAWGWVPMLMQHADWHRDKKINVLFQIGLTQHPKHKDVPLVLDFVKEQEKKEVLSLVMAPQTFARPFVAPPGLTAARTKTLRTAFYATVRDPAFVADAERQGLEVDLLTGEETLDILKKLYATPKNIVARAKAAM